MNAPAIDRESVAALLRSVAARASSARSVAVGSSYLSGEITYSLDGWKVIIFWDSDELDYVAEAQRPDGARSTFDDWYEYDGGDPLDLLTQSEVDALDRALRG
ncbi:MAG: hypothetical protein JNM58_00765 [Xanthomonadaceae bacterium]|nr:hypothetical protein [Xanthomonadaceae bacterium]